MAGDCPGTGPYISAASEHSNGHLSSINTTRNLGHFSFKRRTPLHSVKLSVLQMPSHKFVTVILGVNVTVVLGVNAILAATEN